MEAKFKNLDGSLTAYAFACGYVQTEGDYRLFKDGCWHIQGAGIWKTYGSLTVARRELKKFAKCEHEWEEVFNNDDRLIGRECLNQKCNLFVSVNDVVGAI